MSTDQVPGHQRRQLSAAAGWSTTAEASSAKAAHDAGTPAEADLRPGTDLPPGTVQCVGSNCRKPVRWVLTLGDKRMPIDPDPHPDGNVIRIRLEDGSIRARVLGGTELPAQGEAWMPHWRTCPDSPEFRTRKTRTGPKCKACDGPMDPELARAERWTMHPACDYRHLMPTRERTA